MDRRVTAASCLTQLVNDSFSAHVHECAQSWQYFSSILRALLFFFFPTLAEEELKGSKGLVNKIFFQYSMFITLHRKARPVQLVVEGSGAMSLPMALLRLSLYLHNEMRHKIMAIFWFLINLFIFVLLRWLKSSLLFYLLRKGFPTSQTIEITHLVIIIANREGSLWHRTI